MTSNVSRSSASMQGAVDEFNQRLRMRGLPPVRVSFMEKRDEAYTDLMTGRVVLGKFAPSEAPAALAHEYIHSIRRVPHLAGIMTGFSALTEQDANFSSGVLLAMLGYPIQPAMSAVSRIRQRNSRADAAIATGLMAQGYQLGMLMGAGAAMGPLAANRLARSAELKPGAGGIASRRSDAVDPSQGKGSRAYANANPWPGYRSFDASALGDRGEWLVSDQCTLDPQDTFRIIEELKSELGPLPEGYRDHAVARAYWRRLHEELLSSARFQLKSVKELLIHKLDPVPRKRVHLGE
ncbi:MAG: hypothetical protein AAFY60_14350, partial [Myxococcota bacterium]